MLVHQRLSFKLVARSHQVPSHMTIAARALDPRVGSSDPGEHFVELKHGSLNVPIEHHPTIRYMVYNGYYKVMSNIPKMGHLPTSVKSQSVSGFLRGSLMGTLWWTNILQWKITMLLMGKSTISMAMFNCKLLVHQRVRVIMIHSRSSWFFHML